jgi:hypothetical protein
MRWRDPARCELYLSGLRLANGESRFGAALLSRASLPIVEGLVPANPSRALRARSRTSVNGISRSSGSRYPASVLAPMPPSRNTSLECRPRLRTVIRGPGSQLTDPSTRAVLQRFERSRAIKRPAISAAGVHRIFLGDGFGLGQRGGSNSHHAIAVLASLVIAPGGSSRVLEATVPTANALSARAQSSGGGPEGRWSSVY